MPQPQAPEVKTVKLTGTEIAVPFSESHPNYWVINLGDSDLYASARPNIVPDADGVYPIYPGGRERIKPGSNNTIYIFGTGKALIRAENDQDCPSYNPAAKTNSSGNGGSITVDTALSNTSVNPVQNKVVSAALESKADTSAVNSGLFDIRSYVGYSEDDILGVNADFDNGLFKRLKDGTSFDFTILPNAKRCTVDENMSIIAYEGDADFADDGSNGTVVWYIPKFYSKFVPLLYRSDHDNGYDIKEGNFFISSVRKGDFTLHNAFYDLDANEIDYILMSVDGKIYDFEFNTWLNDNAMVAEYYILRGNAVLAKKGFKPMEEIVQCRVDTFADLPSPADANIANRPRLGYIYYVGKANEEGVYTDLTRYFWNGKEYKYY